MCSLYVVMLLSCGIGPRSVLVDLLSTIFRTVPLLEVISEVLYPRTWIEVAVQLETCLQLHRIFNTA
jgi:hypothetical protein